MPAARVGVAGPGARRPPRADQRAPRFGDLPPDRLTRWCLGAAHRVPPTWLGQQLAQLARRVVERHGALPFDAAVGRVRMRCHLHRNNSERKFVFMPWRFDPGERRALRTALPPDGVFVDVGANVGLYAMTMALHLGPLGWVIALEPNPEARRRLTFNLAATRNGSGSWPRVDVVAVAAGADADGPRRLHLDETNLGGASLLPRPGGGPSLPVGCRPLAEVLRELEVPRVDALKVDVEGCEDEVLVPFLGSAPESMLPGCLVVEDRSPQWRWDLPELLRRRGYVLASRTRLNAVFHRR